MTTSRERPSFEGRGKTLHEAAQDAADKAKSEVATPRTFEILEIKVRVENPITEYIVLLAPEP